MNDVCNGLGLHIDKRYLDQAEACRPEGPRAEPRRGRK